jgi:hypothetical protein
VEVDGLTLVAERVQGNRVGRIRIVPRHKASASASTDNDPPGRRE